MSDNPSGWQQRIAAIDPRADDRNDGHCFFCGAWYRFDDDARLVCDPHKPDCLWQNAKDALPPQSSGWHAEDERKAIVDYILSCRENRDVVQVFDVMAKHIHNGVHLKDAFPPAPPADLPALDELRRVTAQRLRAASTRAHRHAAGRRDTIGRHRSMWHECSHPDCSQDRAAADALEPFFEALPPAPEASPARFCECIGVAGHPNFVRTQHGRSVCVHCDLPRRADASPAKETS